MVGMVACAGPQATSAVAKPTAVAKAPATLKPALRSSERGRVTSISMSELFALQQSGKVLIYDARPSFFYHLGHLPGAISLPKDGGDAEIQKHESEIKAAIAIKKPIVVYCTNLLCADARTVASHLSSFGYSSAVMSGGWDAWKEAGLPTE